MTHSIIPIAGIDVAKKMLDVAIHGRVDTWRVDNTPSGWERLLADLRAAGVGEVGMEATGGYERGVADHLAAGGLKVVVLQPIQVRAFARAALRRAKNDRLDATLIAAFTAVLGGRGRNEDPRLAKAAELLVFIEQTEDDIVRFKTRLEHTRDPRLRHRIEADIARLKTRREHELARVVATLRAHDDLARRLCLLVGIPGIGERTAVTLLVLMPELGSLSREQAASLAGLAPFDRDSADSRGERHIAGGRSRVRSAVYKATVAAATRWNPNLVAVYRRLRAAGKNPKLAFVACARKLLIMANTVLARGTPWLHDAPPSRP